MATKITRSNIETVKRLMKPDLKYEQETGEYKNPRSIDKILATHGTSIEKVVQLAIHGRFVRDDEIIDEHVGDEFYATPNAKYSRLDSVGMFPDYVEKIKELGVSAVKESIGYAWRPDDGEGVVIGFKDQLSDGGYQIFYGENGGQEVPELIVPKPPSLHIIEGIYPVDAGSANELRSRLEEL